VRAISARALANSRSAMLVRPAKYALVPRSSAAWALSFQSGVGGLFEQACSSKTATAHATTATRRLRRVMAA